MDAAEHMAGQPRENPGVESALETAGLVWKVVRAVAQLAAVAAGVLVLCNVESIPDLH